MTHRILPLIACLLLLAQWSHADDSSLTIKDVIDTGEKAEAVIADSLQDDSIRPGDTPLSTMLAIMNAAQDGNWGCLLYTSPSPRDRG